MKCPFCGYENTRVIDSRPAERKPLNRYLLLIRCFITQRFGPDIHPEFIRIILIRGSLFDNPVSCTVAASGKRLPCLIMSERQYGVAVYHNTCLPLSVSNKRIGPIPSRSLNIHIIAGYFLRKSGIFICLDSTLLVRGETPLNPPPKVVGSGLGPVFWLTPCMGCT